MPSCPISKRSRSTRSSSAASDESRRRACSVARDRPGVPGSGRGRRCRQPGVQGPREGVRERHSLHEVQRASAWFKAAPGLQEILVGGAPNRFFVPPYVGHHGWVGAYLDVEQDWEELADLIEESYRMTAPKRLVAQLGD